MIQHLNRLSEQHPFFQGMEDRHIRVDRRMFAMNVRFEAGHVIFREGDPADHFYLIREGLVSVQFVSRTRASRLCKPSREGEVLGWSWLFASVSLAF